MMAIGFLFFIFGLLPLKIFYVPSYIREKIEFAGLSLVTVGGMLMVASAAVKLWEIMP